MKKQVKVAASLLIICLIAFLGLRSYLGLNFFQALIQEAGLEKKPVLAEESVKPKLPRLEEVSLLAAGDIMYHMPQVRGAYSNGVYDFNNNFKYISSYAEGADLAIANFETVAAGRELGYSGYPAFNSPVESLESIKKAGFDIVNTANNHILDRGKDGVFKTLDNIKRLGLKNIGTSRDGEDKFLIEDVRGVKLGFLSYTYGCNGNEAAYSKEDREGFINFIDEGRIYRDIDKMRPEVDFLVLYIHWGQEYQLSPNESQTLLADKLLARGVDIILGSHPHVIQRAEETKLDGQDKFVVYSLGNFISNQRYESLKNYNTEDGLMVNLRLEKNFDTGQKRIVAVDYIPTWVNKYTRDSRNNYEIIPIEPALGGQLDIYNYPAIEDRLRKSYERTQDRINNR